MLSESVKFFSTHPVKGQKLTIDYRCPNPSEIILNVSFWKVLMVQNFNFDEFLTSKIASINFGQFQRRMLTDLDQN